MSVHTRRHDSGLVLAEYARDEAAISRALKQMNDRFVLWPPDGLSPYYRVVYHVSDWQEARTVCTWMDEQGKPLPLSSGILTEVDKLRLDGRNREPDADEFNRQRQEQIDKVRAERGQAIVDDHKAKVERGQTSVSMGPRSKLRYYQRTSRPKAA